MSDRDHKEELLEIINKVRDREYSTSEEGEALAEKLRSAAKTEEDPYLKGNCLSTLAEHAYMQEENPDHVFAYGIEAIPYLENAHDMTGLSRTYNILAIEYFLRGFLSGAMENFLKSLSYSKQIENGEGHIGVEYLNIANVYHAMKANETALEYALKCVPILERDNVGKNERRNLVLAYTLTGLLYMELNENLKEAEAYCDKALKLLAEDSVDDPDAPYNEYWLLIAEVEKSKGNEDSYNTIVDLFVERVRAMGIHGDEIDTIMDLLDYLIEIGDAEHFNKMIAFCEEIEGDLAPSYRVRMLSDKLQCAKITGNETEMASLALRYYEASKEQDVIDRETALQSMKEKQMIEEIREENRRLADLAQTDALSGLPNRYHLGRQMDAMFEKAYNLKTSLAVEILDVDYFKQYNDTLGHQAGDECIKAIAGVMKEIVAANPKIFAARYGGDEFMILYDDMSDEEVLGYAELLREKVTALGLKHPATASGLVSVTQGIRNSVPSWKNKLWDYTFTADNALYEAKKGHKGEIMLMKKASMSQDAIDQAHLF